MTRVRIAKTHAVILEELANDGQHIQKLKEYPERYKLGVGDEVFIQTRTFNEMMDRRFIEQSRFPGKYFISDEGWKALAMHYQSKYRGLKHVARGCSRCKERC